MAQEMPMPAQGAMPAQQGDMPGLAQKIVVQIDKMLQQLGEALGQAGLPPESMDKLGQIIAQYQDFIASDLGGEESGEPKEEPAPALAPMETQGKPAKLAL